MVNQIQNMGRVLRGASLVILAILVMMINGFIIWDMALMLLIAVVCVSGLLVGIFYFVSRGAVVQLHHMESDDLGIGNDDMKKGDTVDEVLSEDAAREWLDHFLVEQQRK